MGVSPMSGTAVPAVASKDFTAKSLHDPRSGMAVVRLQAAVNRSAAMLHHSGRGTRLIAGYSMACARESQAPEAMTSTSLPKARSSAILPAGITASMRAVQSS